MQINLPQEKEPEFQMAPMIDMVFLLLVFFMCASHLSQTQNIELEIPTASKAVVPKERPDRWVVNIQKDGSLYSGSNPVKLDELAQMIKADMALRPHLKVYLRADAESPHKQIKKVMNGLAEVGMDSFIFGTYKPTAKAGETL